MNCKFEIERTRLRKYALVNSYNEKNNNAQTDIDNNKVKNISNHKKNNHLKLSFEDIKKLNDLYERISKKKY